MADETAPEGSKTEAEPFKAIGSQDELDRVISARITRERAKFADYDAVKAKAAEFDKATDAQKSETQKANDRADIAERGLAVFVQRDQVATWAKDVVKGTTIPADVLRGSTEDEIKAHFEQVKAGWALASPATKRTAVPTGKSTTDTGGSPAVAALRRLRQGA